MKLRLVEFSFNTEVPDVARETFEIFTMPCNDLDATDPMTLHGVIIETDNNNAMRDMAR